MKAKIDFLTISEGSSSFAAVLKVFKETPFLNETILVVSYASILSSSRAAPVLP